MYGYINGTDFYNIEPMKYYSPPATWDEKRKKENAQNKIFSGEWYGSLKKDGYFTKLIKDEDGNILLCSRNRNVKGEFPEKHEWVPHLNSFFNWLPNGSCLLGELYLPSKPGSRNITTILGCLKDKAISRQEKNEKLNFYIFDVLAWNNENTIDYGFYNRIIVLYSIEALFSESKCNKDFVSFATYYNGKELWDHLHYYLINDEEGMVIMHEKAPYRPGKRPSKETLKIKKELSNTIDCFFDGSYNPPSRIYTGKEIKNWKYWEDILTNEKIEAPLYEEWRAGANIEPVTKPYFYGWAGSLNIFVLKDNQPICIGSLSGLTDEIKSDPKKYKDKVIEITAMEVLKTGGLRHAKFLNFRPDLNIFDCQYEKVFENGRTC